MSAPPVSSACVVVMRVSTAAVSKTHRSCDEFRGRGQSDAERREKGVQMSEEERVLAGKCECGTVRYRVLDAFRYAANCHCSRCRAATGSAFKPFAGIEREKIELTAGLDALLIHGDDELNDTRCGVCGS